MALTLSPPSQFRGSPQEQLRQCYTYLFLLHQQLNTALSSLEGSKAPAPVVSASSYPSATKEEFSHLKSLIIQNATVVRKEMETLEKELKGSYVAVSDFGTYLQQISAKIEADPTALTQYYSFIASLEADLEAVDSSFQDYLIQTEGYIRTGIVYYDGELPIYGVAVGQGLTTVEKDGQTVVSSSHFRSTFTSQRLSFWQGSTEVAYLSDNRLYITNISVLGSLNFGGNWSISHSGGFTLKWIGS